MKAFTRFLLGLGFVLAGLSGAIAQDMAMMQPPKVLVVTREYLKPGKMGSMHEKAESTFVQAMAKAKWPTHYLAMDSLSGKSRALFFTGYDSFDAWEKDALAEQKNAALSAALEHAAAVDGELLDSMDGGAFVLREDQSLRAGVELPHMRYFEIEIFHIKPGHTREWDEAVKMVKAAYEKGVPDAHWAMYQAIYGHPGGTYVVINPLKSASEIDKGMMQDRDFAAAMGDDGMKKLDELSAKSIESSEMNLFLLNPRMSYVGDEMIKADDFWKRKAPAMPMAPKKSEEKKMGE
jgi:hypothetical protein